MKVLILGAGNMAQAITGRTIDLSSSEYYVCTKSGTSAKLFASKFNINFLDYSEISNHQFDVIWLAMKPQSLLADKADFKLIDSSRAHIISVLAGVTTQVISNIFNNKKIIRIMPNTPSLIGHGVNPCFATKDCTFDFLTSLETSLKKCGISFFLDSEDKIDAITPFTGSGPAYFFEIIRILQAHLVSFGIDSELAKTSLASTMLGSAKMILDSSDGPEELRNKVTSKNGVTFEALQEFEDNDLEVILNKALNRAYKRVLELKG